MKNLFLLPLAFVVLACSTKSNNVTCKNKIVSKLYLGTDTPNGKVTQSQWRTFLDKEITARFPAGLSIYTANGQWLGKDNTITKEESFVVEIIHSDDTNELTAIDNIADAYKTQFSQEAVMLLQNTSNVCFK